MLQNGNEDLGHGSEIGDPRFSAACAGTEPRVSIGFPIREGIGRPMIPFCSEVQYLIDRTKARLSVMKALPGKCIEARHKVLSSLMCCHRIISNPVRFNL